MNVLILLAKDPSVSGLPSKSHFHNIMFNDVNDYLDEVSYGREQVAGNSYGWYTLSSSPCQANIGGVEEPSFESILAQEVNSTQELINLADPDVDYTQYDGQILGIIKAGSGCGYGGGVSFMTYPFLFQTQEGPIWMRLFVVYRGVSFHTMGHELLHTLHGFGHANDLDCPTPFPPGYRYSCDSREYRDESSIMSAGVYGGKPEVMAGLKAVKTRRNANDYYYLEWRHPIGYDVSIPPENFEGAMLRTGQSMLPDMPSSSTSRCLTTSVTDNNNGTQFEVLNIGSTLELKVTLGDPDISPPTGTIPSPAEGDTVSGIIQFEATVNDDRGIYEVRFTNSLGTLDETDSSPPYQINLNTQNYTDGSMALYATARDLSGNGISFGPRRIFIRNSGLISIENSIVKPPILCPAGDIPYRVWIYDDNDPPRPLPGKIVNLQLYSPDDKLHMCSNPDQDFHQWEVTTDANGMAEFDLAGGGCGGKAWVQAEGVKLHEWSGGLPILSLDVVSDGLVLVPDGNVGLADAQYFTPIFQWGHAELCADFDGDGWAGLEDAVFATPHIKEAHVCQ
jgi:hypothetical protein